MTLNTPLDFALAYAAAGYKVLPANGKIPLVEHGAHDGSSDETTLRQWWTKWPAANIGLVLDGLVAVDIDPRNGGDIDLLPHPLPDTCFAKTGGGGSHYLFRSRNGTKYPGKLALGIDLKHGAGSYICVEPSVHASGQKYVWLDETEPWTTAPANAPEWLALPPGQRANGENTAGAILEGGRNGHLTSLAGSMRRRNMSVDAILSALLVENSMRCAPPLGDDEVRKIAASVGRYAPAADMPEPKPLPGKVQEPRALGLMSDMRNAWRLVQVHGNSLLHVSDIGFHIWAGTHWNRDADGALAIASRLSRSVASEAAEILAKASEIADKDKREKKLLLGQALSEFAIKCEQRSKIEAALSLVRVYRNAKPGDLDCDPWLFNCANGTLDLRSGDLRPHRQSDLLTRVAPVAYDKNATAPRWLAFLDRIFAGDQELIGFMKHAAGYTLTADISAQVIFLLSGGGANGKSVLVTTLQTLLGDYAKTAAPDLLLAKTGGRHPTELADLRGARMVATVESGEGRRLHESLIKQMTGGDAMKARFMFADFFEFEPQFKLWLATNHKPNVRGTDYAIWRRIRLIPFNVTIPENERDPKLVEKLKAELPGILAWAVEGCLDWQKGGLRAPARVIAATELYRAEMDVIARFIKEACVLHPQAEIKATFLYRACKAWCEDNGERYESQTMFGRRLDERGFTKRVSGGVIWAGIRVSEDFHSKNFDEKL